MDWRQGNPVFGEGRQRLLAAVHQWGSINRAASEPDQPGRHVVTLFDERYAESHSHVGGAFAPCRCLRLE